MDIIAQEITEAEPCYGWMETDRLWQQVDGSIPVRRLRFIFVLRGDAIAKYVEDMGPAADFKDFGQFAIMADGESVAQVRFMADASRDDTTYQRITREFKEGSTLLHDAINEAEINRKVIQNQSVFGPSLAVQRNGVPASMKGILK